MKKQILLMILSLPLVAMAGNMAFVIELSNGTTANFLLQDKPTLRMEDTKINISTNTVQASYEKAEVKRFYFTNEASGVKKMAPNNIVYKQIDGDRFEIIGLSKNEQITVCDITGGLICDVSRTNDKATINLSGHKQGVYLIKVGNCKTIKIIKK